MSVYLTKKTGEGELETATPSEVAEVVFSNDDVEIFTTAEKSKLEQCAKIVFLTQAEYDAIAIVDPDIWYNTRPAI